MRILTSQLYTAQGGETLQEIAEKTGTDYSQLVKNNPAYKTGKIKKGSRIILSVAQVLEEKADEEEAENEKKQQQTAAKKQEYQIDIQRAREDYQMNKASADADYLYKKQKLSQALKKNRIGLESDLAAQKIDASSIAGNEREKLSQEAAQEVAELDRGYDEKINKLKTKLSRNTADANRKISRL